MTYQKAMYPTRARKFLCKLGYAPAFTNQMDLLLTSSLFPESHQASYTEKIERNRELTSNQLGCSRLVSRSRG